MLRNRSRRLDYKIMR
ncbi:hypothetical protein PS042_13035 [Escherichia albertii]|uniref:Uncharacterized protein n=1 Tax=Escherichia albertii TaxID=208962 RepID=A0AAX3MT08_ESCAL|nr:MULTISPECIES: hypothetical protein [Enterobacteriaceae]MCB2258782.1 hypothetical protein [Escherichia albertii]MCB2266060.1 hypothetical protein [Escherichia albertii]MCB2270783.1 hypothetical protein [Escherichia albertii]MCJ2196961.1 hypothetical protein [Escherichia albertii NBRC 107761 = DSM 17582]MCQ8908242.1 hypothetical protein [Escherichia albertii]